MTVRMARPLAVLFATAAIVLGLSAPAMAATFTVNTTNDVNDGSCNAFHCSLREAIHAANAAGGADTITFNILGVPPFTIIPTSALPTITSPVTIDGTTQPGFAGNPIIELNGSAAGLAMGLSISAGGSTVRGLVVNRFRGNAGINIASTANGNVIEGNWVGLDTTGSIAAPNIFGVFVSSSGNTIGGTSAATRNVMSGNLAAGIRIDGASNRVWGNYIGTDSSGTAAIANSDGATILGFVNSIGGTFPGTRNVISGNRQTGVLIAGAIANVVQGNLIGMDASATAPLGNLDSGVLMQSSARDNLVGGAAPGAGNVIAHNGNSGVGILAGTGNRISSNSIFGNMRPPIDRLGINLGVDQVTPNDPGDADTGANNLQNFPVLSSVTPSGSGAQISGTLNSQPNNAYTLEFFSNLVCDTSLHGEGERFLGSTTVNTDGSGNATFTFMASSVPPGHTFFTATATDPAGNTSEFSACRMASTTPIPTSVNLDPAADTNPVGTSHTVTATVRDAGNQPVPNVDVEFTVSGSVTDSGSCTTNAAGQCSFTYQGPTQPGADVIRAFADTDNDGTQDAGEPLGGATKIWVAAAPATLTLDPAAATNTVGTSHTVTATVRDAFGNPVPGIVVRFTVSGSVSDSGNCTTNAVGQCSFTYPGPQFPGSDVIRAFADTDNDGTQDPGEPEGEATKAWVAPASTPGHVTGGGKIQGTSGPVTFSVHAQSDEDGQKGGCNVVDKGADVKIKCLDVTNLVVTGTHATIFGNATVNGAATSYRIDVDDLGESGRGTDTFTIQTTSGYNEGGQLTAGNIQIHS